MPLDDSAWSKEDATEASANVHDEATKLYAAFAVRMNKLSADGLQDFKLKLAVSPETTVPGIVRTLNNVLRLYEAGEAKPLDYLG